MRRRQKSVQSVPLSARFRPDPQKRLEFIPGQMILKIKGPALSSTVGTLKAGGARLAARVEQEIPESVSGPLDYLKTNAGLKAATPLFAEKGKHKLSGLKAGRIAAITSVADSPHEDLQGYTVVSVDPKKVSSNLMKHVSASRAIQFLEPMPARWIAKKRRVATDSMQHSQWGLRAMGWFEAERPSSQQAVRIKVAILDTGVDMAHPDLDGVVSFYDHQGNRPEDIVGHGTHVAGIIAATNDNGQGISGLVPCRLAVWKIFNDRPINGEFYVNGELYLRALGLLPDEGCTVVNLSIGGTQQSRTEALLFKRLRERNVLAIAAMGNEYEEGDPTEFPAAYNDVLGVGAISSELRRAAFSNTGRHIWVAAPGHTILSTVPTKSSPFRDETNYATWSGTSMATPHVAGAAAAYLGKHRNAKADQVADALKRTAKRLPQMRRRTFTVELGHGLVFLPKLLS
jgi:hypothetical protein